MVGLSPPAIADGGESGQKFFRARHGRRMSQANALCHFLLDTDFCERKVKVRKQTISKMYLILLIIGALACLPEIDIAYASLELNAWLLIGISLSGLVFYGIYIYKRKWPLILPHLFISASFVLVFYVSVLLIPFGGPSAAIYNHYSSNLGPKAEKAVPTLLPLLRFNYPQIGYNGGMVRQYAVEALGKISTDTNVIKAIQESLNDPDPDVREAAEEALKKDRVVKP